jgi:hypothetical protein
MTARSPREASPMRRRGLVKRIDGGWIKRHSAGRPCRLA